MKQIFHRYEVCEDYLAGLYRLPGPMDCELHVSIARMILTRQSIFYNAAIAMVEQWPIAAENNLSNLHRNRQAWIGQATCCFVQGVAEHETKAAWNLMSPQQQLEANNTADEVIKEWEKAHA